MKVARVSADGGYDSCHVAPRFTRVAGVHSQDVQHIPKIQPHGFHNQQHLAPSFTVFSMYELDEQSWAEWS